MTGGNYNVPDYNPYDPATTNQTPETLPPDEILKRAIAAGISQARVMVPAQIVAIKGNQKVDAQILLQTRYLADNSVVTLPPCQNVMVNMPMGNGWRIKMPLKIGDTGFLLFCDRSLDVWSAGNGGVVDPQDSRSHDLSDPIFVPGLVPFSGQSNDDPDQMLLVNGDAEIVLMSDGKFQIKNKQQELLNNLVQLVQTLSTASTVAGGPFVPDVVNTLTQIAENIQSLMGS